MNTFFVELEKAERYRLLVADDDVDMYEIVRMHPWRTMTDEELVNAYKTSAGPTTVLLLDSSIVMDSGMAVSVTEWIGAFNLETTLAEGRVLILYSGEPFCSPAFYRSYAKSGASAGDLEVVIRLLEEGRSLSDWPQKLVEPLNGLSRTIHALQNLFLPVTLDAETLKDLSKVPDQATMADVFGDHFAASASGYLSRQSEQHQGGEILQRVEALCKSLEPDVGLEIERQKAAVAAAVESARQIFGKQANCDLDSTTLPSVNDLQIQLRKIASAGDELVQALRGIRKKKQGAMI